MTKRKARRQSKRPNRIVKRAVQGLLKAFLAELEHEMPRIMPVLKEMQTTQEGLTRLSRKMTAALDRLEGREFGIPQKKSLLSRLFSR